MRDFDFEALLDEVLQENAHAEARPGMEQRILARMREEGVRGAGLARVWWLGAAALAACLVVALVVHQRVGVGPDLQRSPVLPVTADKAIPASPDGADKAPPGGVAQDSSSRPRGAKRAMRVRSKETEAVVEQARDERLPKMDTFPAVTQKGSLPVASSHVAEAMQELKAAQERPLEVSAIEIKPL